MHRTSQAMPFSPIQQGSSTHPPQRTQSSTERQAQLKHYAEVTLGPGSLRLAVSLPEGEDVNEWIAMYTADFYDQITMLYRTLADHCTPQNCPTMSAGPRFEYQWADGVQIKKPIKCSAPAYINYLMTWVRSQLDDEAIFPCKIGVPFPKVFPAVAKRIFKRLFRVYAHIYHSHFGAIGSMGQEAHLNTSFKHFMYFVEKFDLVDKKEQTPLNALIQAMGQDDA